MALIPTDRPKLWVIGGLLILTLALAGCGVPGFRPKPTPTPTQTPRPTSTAQATVTPTVTPTATVPIPATPTPWLQAVTPLAVFGDVASCLPQTINSDQHLSASGSYTLTQWDASGPMACRILPGSCAYGQLVGNLDADILFQRAETAPFDHEDILMHPAMLAPLGRLRQLVNQEWDGKVKLLVTDAYDSLLEHDLNQTDPTRKYSLHFEGRAIDLVTYPVDLALYPRLCALAHCAGFDWVHNEGSHCHASVRADSLCLRCSSTP